MLQPSRSFWEVYELYNIKGMHFEGLSIHAMLQQLPKLVPLFFAVAFGSSLDISAIQTEAPEPLDYNRQLSTIGDAILCMQTQLALPCHLVIVQQLSSERDINAPVPMAKQMD